jgi:hypothetical protein
MLHAAFDLQHATRRKQMPTTVVNGLTLNSSNTDKWSFDNIATTMFNQIAAMDAAIKTAMDNLGNPTSGTSSFNSEDVLALQFQIGKYTSIASSCTETVKSCKECISEITRNLS